MEDKDTIKNVDEEIIEEKKIKIDEEILECVSGGLYLQKHDPRPCPNCGNITRAVGKCNHCGGPLND